MNKTTKIIISILIVWNIALTFFVFALDSFAEKTTNRIRNIYNKETTMTLDELDEEGTRWIYYERLTPEARNRQIQKQNK